MNYTTASCGHSVPAIEPRSRRPFVTTMYGQHLEIRLKGQRRTFTVTWWQIYLEGARNAAVELKRAKAQRKAERAKLAKGL